MTDTTEPTTTPQQLQEELTELFFRTIGSPLPRHAGALGWQMQASALAIGFTRALHALDEVAPKEAAELAKWWDGPLGEGPDGEEFAAWAYDHVARNPEQFQEWIDNGRQAAQQAASSTPWGDEQATTHPLAVTDELPAETTQPSGDWEDCNACSEVQDMCRYHRGITAGYGVLREAAKKAPAMTVAELLAELDAES